MGVPLRCLWSLILLSVLCGAVVSHARTIRPEGPSGHASCVAGTADEDQDDLANSADPGCASAAAFVAFGTASFAAQAEDGVRFGAAAAVSDPTASPTGGTGAYTTIPVGTATPWGGWAFSGIPSGDYYLSARARIISPAAAKLWVQIVTPPAPPKIPPENTQAGLLNSGQIETNWRWMQIGSFDTLTGAPGSPGWHSQINATPRRVLTIATGDLVVIHADPDLHLDCLFATPVGAPEPEDCPASSGGGGPAVADYLVKELGGSNVVTVNGAAEAFWTQANALQATGGNFGAQVAWTKYVAWSDSLNRVYFLITGTLEGLAAETATGNDQSALFNDTRVEFVVRFLDTTEVKDAATYKFMCSIGSRLYDANYPAGVSSTAYTFPDRACAAIYNANVLTIEGYIQPSETLTAGQFFRFDGLVLEKVTGIAQTYQYWRCQTSLTSDPSCWGLGQLSSTAMAAPSDTTPATITAVSAPVQTSTSLTLSCTARDNAAGPLQVAFDYGTTTSYLGGGSPGSRTTLVAATNSDCIDPNTCTATQLITGLAAATTYHYRCVVRDQAGNETIGSDATQATAGAGDTFYVSTTGSDGNVCSAGSRCATVAGVMAKAGFGPGDTIVVGNGTYTNGAGKTPNITCSQNAAKFNGTSTAPITLRAENERQAFFQATDWTVHPLWMRNCAYWTIEGFRIEAADITGGLTNGHAVAIQDSTQMTFRRNLVRFNNRYRNGSIVNFGGSTDSLIEENEVYSWHRNGTGGGSRNTYRLNYVNSRAHADISGGNPSNNGAQKGDSGFIFYPSSDNLVENNISETNYVGYDLQATAETQRNRFYGNISIGDHYGTMMTGRGATSLTMPIDNFVTNFLALNPINYGFYTRAGRGNTCTNCTVYGQGGTFASGGVVSDKNSTSPNWTGDGNYSTFAVNLLATALGGRGVSMSPDIDAWTITNANIVANGQGNNPDSSANYVALTALAAGLGAARACIPMAATNLKGTGVGNEDRGANILYRSFNGVVGTTRIWTTMKPDAAFAASSAGRYFLGCGAKVTGVNDVVGTSCYTVADRLNMTTAVLNSCAASGTYGD